MTLQSECCDDECKDHDEEKLILYSPEFTTPSILMQPTEGHAVLRPGKIAWYYHLANFLETAVYWLTGIAAFAFLIWVVVN